MMVLKRFILIAGIICLLAGCNNGQTEGQVASVNGEGVSKAEFDAYLKFKRADTGDAGQKDRALDDYLERKALTDVINQSDLLDNEMMEAELEDFKMQMYISRYFDLFLKKNVTDQAVRNYYNTRSEQYSEEKAHAAHILIRTHKKMTEPERKVKLTIAREAYSRVKKGDDFKDIAEAYSEDRISGKKGGDLGWMKKGSINKQFSDVLFSLKPGEVSEPFETPFGFHILTLIDGPAVVKRPFDAVAGDIRYQLRAKAKKAEIERLMKEITIAKQ